MFRARSVSASKGKFCFIFNTDSFIFIYLLLSSFVCFNYYFIPSPGRVTFRRDVVGCLRTREHHVCSRVFMIKDDNCLRDGNASNYRRGLRWVCVVS